MNEAVEDSLAVAAIEAITALRAELARVTAERDRLLNRMSQVGDLVEEGGRFHSRRLGRGPYVDFATFDEAAWFAAGLGPAKEEA